jgi:FlaG/FlaF family flagellin (archaellin)
MYLEVRKRKSWKNSEGVSEVIGNIMILAITVVLFGSIIAFVGQMPMPQQTTKANFSASIIFWDGGTQANLTIIHAGGATMRTTSTIILVEVDNVATRYNLSDEPSMAGLQYWTTGTSWKKTLEDTTYASNVLVTVVDLEKSSLVWQSQVTGGSGGNPPNILQRYVDSDANTPSPDPVKEFDDFSFYATISDPDGDLNTTNGVWIDSSDIEGAGYSKRFPDFPASGGIYRWDFLDIQDRELNTTALDGGTIMIYAVDSAGHVSASTFIMVVTDLPIQQVYPDLPPIIPPVYGDSGLPAYLSWFFDNQGFGVYAEMYNGSQPLGIVDTNAPQTTFVKDHMVFIRFASMVMTNVLAENRLLVIDTRTGMPMTPEYTGSSTASKPFYPYPTGGGAYVYECQFNTTPLPPSAYTLSIYLKNQPSASAPQRSFQADKMILVTDPNSPIQFVPEMLTYKDASYTIPWGDKYTPFQIASSDSFKVYVKIKVQNTDNPANPSVAEIRIKDMTGASELYGTPPSGAMISDIFRYDANYYNFSIDLRLNNGVQWRAGNNSYTLFVSKLNDTNEGMYSLSGQVFVTGAGQRADFLIGTAGMASGQSNFNTREYLYYIQNNLLFSSRVLWLSESTPGSNTDYTTTALADGDIDADGDKDILMAQTASNYLYYFENTLNTFGTWQSGSMVSRPDGYTYRITWIATGDINGDERLDFAYVNSNGQIVLYESKYGSLGRIYTAPATKGWSTPVAKIALADMTDDGRADLIVLGAGRITIYDLKYTLDPAFVFDFNDMARFAYSTGATSVDFDIDDMNNDGKLDIVTAGTTAAFGGGVAGVNVNYYTTQAGNQVILDYDLQGWIPQVTAGNVSNGSVENTQLADGTMISFCENGTGDDAGRVIMTMRFNTLTDKADQELRLYARNGAISGTAQEVFYVWYSIDNYAYIPIMTISGTSFRYYTYTLPSNVMNHAIYLRITDSLLSNTSGSVRDFVQIDMVGVFTDTFGGYTGVGVVADTTWTCVRAGNIDGSVTYKEVVVAKHHDSIAANSLWKVYSSTDGVAWTALAGQPPGATSFFLNPNAKLSDPYFANVAPTLFDVVDINGDGYSDILTTNLTTTAVTGYCISDVGFYMNLWSGSSMYYRYFLVHEWYIDRPTGAVKNPYVTINMAIPLVVTG